MKCKIILNKENIAPPHLKYVVGNIKYLSTKIDSPVNYWIYDDIVLLVLFQTRPLISIKIKTKLLANSFKNYFEYLWEIADIKI